MTMSDFFWAGVMIELEVDRYEVSLRAEVGRGDYLVSALGVFAVMNTFWLVIAAELSYIAVLCWSLR